MRIHALLIATFLLFGSHAHAQDKGLFAFSAGVGLPMGVYADTDLSNEESGFAGPGDFFHLRYASRVEGGWGWTLRMRVGHNPVDEDALSSALQASWGTRVTVETEPWRVGGILAGVCRSFPVGGKWFVDTDALVGYGQSRYPRVYAVLPDLGGTPIEQEAKVAGMLTTAIGTGLRYNGWGRFSALLGVDYQAGWSTYKDVRTVSVGAQGNTQDIDQPIGVLHVALGAAYRF